MGIKVIYMGSKYGLEKDLVKHSKMFLLPIIGWVDKNFPGKISFLFRLPVSILISLMIMQYYKPHLLIITGGYASVPPGISAIILNIPVFTLALDIHSGKAVKFFSKFSREVFLSTSEIQKEIDSVPATVTGIPLRENITGCKREKAISYFSLNPRKKTILVLGGSRGARKLVQISDLLIENLSKNKWQFIIQTGPHELKNKEENVTAINFIESMDKAYGAADIIISRAGAVVTAEIEKTGKPAILIPYPYAYKNHQLMNAKRLSSEYGNIQLMKEVEVDTERIISLIKSNVDKKREIKKCSAKNTIIKRISNHVWKN